MLAIDFGTSRVKVAYMKDGKAELARIGKGDLPYIPSLFYIGPDGEILVGDEAEDMLSHDPKGVVETLKRKLRDTKIRKNKQKKTPQELVELLFKTVRELVHEGLPHIFTEAPTEVVLTYPAAYTTPEQQLIQTAAQNAGFQKVELITEPEAAALAWQHKGGQLSSDVVVILDCGGGTADWACLKQEKGKLSLYSEVPAGGDDKLGGHDVDVELFNGLKEQLEDDDKEDALVYVEEHQQDVLFRLKEMKERFSTKKGQLGARMRTLRLGKDKIEISEEMLKASIESKVLSTMVIQMKEYLDKVRSSTKEQNPLIMLVGGTGKLNGLKEALEDQCGVQVISWMESEFATVQGALYVNHQVGVEPTKSAASKKKQTKKVEHVKDARRKELVKRARKLGVSVQSKWKVETIERKIKEAEEKRKEEEQKAEVARLVDERLREASERQEEERKKAEQLRIKEEERLAKEAKREKERLEAERIEQQRLEQERIKKEQEEAKKQAVITQAKQTAAELGLEVSDSWDYETLVLRVRAAQLQLEVSDSWDTHTLALKVREASQQEKEVEVYKSKYDYIQQATYLLMIDSQEYTVVVGQGSHLSYNTLWMTVNDKKHKLFSGHNQFTIGKSSIKIEVATNSKHVGMDLFLDGAYQYPVQKTSAMRRVNALEEESKAGAVLLILGMIFCFAMAYFLE